MKKLLLFVIVALFSCNNLNKSEEYSTSPEEVTLTEETELTESVVPHSGPKKTITVKKTKIGPFDCMYQGIVYINQPEDTSFYIWIGYDNLKYQSIHDVHSRYFSVDDKKSLELKEFACYLDSARNTSGQDVSWNYLIHTYDFTKDISISDQEGAYNYLTVGQAGRMIAWINSLDINK
jgi:hypothetical protein